MKVGLQIGATNMDHILEDCRQMGVNDIVLSASAGPKLIGQESITKSSLEGCKEALMKHGIRLSGMIPPNPSREAVMGDNEEETASLCKILKAIGEAGVGVVLFYPLDRFKNYLAEYHYTKPPLEVMPGDEKWGQIIRFFRRVSDIAEAANLKIANHVFAIDVLLEILNTVKSSNLGINFCTGMYMFGYDPYAVIDRFGKERIFLCHARNLIRHGPGRQGHEEVPLDKGDIDMARYIQLLFEAGYDGLIIPEHLGEKGNLDDSVEYLKGLIGGLKT